MRTFVPDSRITMDKLVFCKRFMLWTAIIVAVIIAVLGLLFGRVVEDTLAEEIGKWIVMGIFIIGIFEVFAYVLAPFFYHMIYHKRLAGNSEWQDGQDKMPARNQGNYTCNKQTFFVLFFVKLFVHFARQFRGSFVPVYC